MFNLFRLAFDVHLLCTLLREKSHNYGRLFLFYSFLFYGCKPNSFHNIWFSQHLSINNVILCCWYHIFISFGSDMPILVTRTVLVGDIWSCKFLVNLWTSQQKNFHFLKVFCKFFTGNISKNIMQQKSGGNAFSLEYW